MNSIYSVVWNSELGQWVVASELAKGRKKKTSATSKVAGSAIVALTVMSVAPGAMADNRGTRLGICASTEGADSLSSIAIGGQNGTRCTRASGNSSIAIGASAVAGGAGSGENWSGPSSWPVGDYDQTAVGTRAKATGQRAVSLGVDANAGARYATAIGSDAKATANSAAAFGETSSASGFGALAMGASSSASGGAAVAVGPSASASQANGVALGAYANADRAAGFGGSTRSAVSVGSGGDGVATDTRQIISVARGTQATDAVNVSQLRGVTDVIGGGVTVNPDGTVSKTITVGKTTYNTVAEAIAASADNVDALKWDAAANNGNGAYSAKHGTGAGTNSKIVNVANGAVTSKSKDAVNGSQLYEVQTTAEKGWNLRAGAGAADTIAPGETVTLASGTNTTARYDATNNTLTVNVVDAPIFGGLVTAQGGIDMASTKIVNVGAGTANGDAVNVSQLRGVTDVIGGGVAVNPDGSVSKTITVGGTTYNTVADAIAAKTGDVDALLWDGTANNGVGAYNAKHGVAATSKIVNVADGDVVANSKDAVNGGQLYEVKATAEKGWNLRAGAGAADTIAPGETVTLASGTNTAARYDATNNTLTVDVVDAPTFVGLVTAQAGIDMASTKIVNMGVGTDPNDAINVSQLRGVTDTIGGGVSVNPDGSISKTITVGGTTYNTVADAIAAKTGSDALNWDSGLGAYNAKHGVDAVNKIVNVASGTVAKESKDAINGGQLYDASQSVANVIGGGSTVDTDTGGITPPDIGVNDKNGDPATNIVDALQGLNSRTADAVIYDAADHGNVTLTGATYNPDTKLGGTRLRNLAWGVDSGDAVNVDQLNATKIHYYSFNDGGTRAGNYNNDGATAENSMAVGINAVASGANSLALGFNTTASHDNSVALGEGSSTMRENSVDVGGRTIANVGSASELDEALSLGRWLELADQATSAGVRAILAAGDANDADASADDQVRRTLRSSTQPGTAEGAGFAVFGDGGMQSPLAATDAVSLQQLADALGGGAKVDANGQYVGPAYVLHNPDGTTTTVNNVGDVVQSLDSRTTQNTQDISNITNQINGAGVGLVKQDATSREIQVAANTGGKVVNVAGTEGNRTIAGVAAGKADNEAINVKQLKDAGVIDANGNAKAVATYDNANKTSMTLGGTGATAPVAVHNMAAGVADNDGVNVSQLNQRLERSNADARAYTDTRFDQTMGRIDSLEGALNDRFNIQDQRIDRMGAMNSAMSTMAASLAGVHAQNRVGVGVGSTNGEAALSVGYQRAVSDRANFTLGASATDDDHSVGAAFGLGW